MVKKESEHGVFYMGVRDPIDVRRNLLENAREAIHFLKRYEKLKSLRTEKMQAILKLDTEVKELRALMTKLRKVFPTTKMHMNFPMRKPQCVVCGDSFKNQGLLTQHMKRHEPKKKMEPIAEKPVVLEKRSQKGDVDELEDELAEIEDKLDKLA